MKKILAIIPTLLVAGALLFSPITSGEGQQMDVSEQNTLMMYDPGVGW
ncbi:hypothetical protein [Bacillus pseudomycoides]